MWLKFSHAEAGAPFFPGNCELAVSGGGMPLLMSPEMVATWREWYKYWWTPNPAPRQTLTPLLPWLLLWKKVFCWQIKCDFPSRFSIPTNVMKSWCTHWFTLLALWWEGHLTLLTIIITTIINEGEKQKRGWRELKINMTWGVSHLICV